MDSEQERQGTEIRLDPAQEQAAEALATQESVVVLGAAGTGKSTVILEALHRAVGQDAARRESVIVLTSDRRGAERLRNLASRRTPGASAASVMSFAYSLLRDHARAHGTPPPMMVTGGQQDAVLAEMLAGYRLNLAAGPRWPQPITPEVTSLPAFRHELRDVLMRCAERGIGPAQLEAVARAAGREDWSAVAEFFAEYEDVMSLRSTVGEQARPWYDVAGLIAAAADVLDEAHAGGEQFPMPWTRVLVDDYQEASAATARLMGALRRHGVAVGVVGNPDGAVQAFRGARPALLAMADAPVGSQLGALGAQRLVLPTTYRCAGPAFAASQRVASHIGTVAGAQHRRVEPAPGLPQAGVTRWEVDSVDAEHRLVVDTVVRARVVGGTPWTRIGVVTRAAADAEELRRALVAARVPVTDIGPQLPLAQEPAVAPLLAVVDWVCAAPKDGERQGEPTAQEVALAPVLLSSVYGSVDSLGLRRLRRVLLAADNTVPRRSSAQLLAALVFGEERVDAPLAGATRIAVDRVRRMVDAARRAAVAAGNVHAVEALLGLWQVWQAAGVSELWRQTALAGGPAGLRADQDLDAVLALLREAEFLTEREGSVSWDVFAARLRERTVVSDTVAERGQRPQGVTVSTAAGVAGLDFDVVVVAGVQDGSWPDIRLRDSLLGAAALADELDSRGGTTDVRAARRAVLDDELRTFYVALTRARRSVVVTSVRSSDAQPSVFCDLVAPDGPDPLPASLDVPWTATGVAIAARRGLETALRSGDESVAEQWAALAVTLARQGVEAADPAYWYGIAPPSSTAPPGQPGAVTRVSPSRLATAHACSLRWALEAADAVAPSGTATAFGSLVHRLAELYPDEGPAALLARFDEAVENSDLPDTYSVRREVARVRQAVAGLGAFQEANGMPTESEWAFSVDVGGGRLEGRIDRVDVDADGTAVVTDFKTGRTVASGPQAQVYPQLAAYQVAVDAADNGWHSGGARLVYPGHPLAKQAWTQRAQPPLVAAGDPSWGQRMVAQAVEIMSAARVWARPSDLCKSCPVRSSCPVQAEGLRVCEPMGAPQAAPGTAAPMSSFVDVEARQEQAAGQSGEEEGDRSDQ